MKIALVIYGRLDTLTGGYLYDRQMTAALEKAGDQVNIISLPYRGYLRHLEDNFSASLLRQVESYSPDILLEDELNHPSLFSINNHLHRKTNLPILSVVHHLRSSESFPDWQILLYQQIERRYLRSLDGCIYNSTTTRRAVESLAGKEIPGIIAYPGGDRFNPQIGTAKISARCQQPGPLRLVFLGSLIPRKGLHTLIEAVALLPRGFVHLDIVGDLAADPAYVRQMRQRSRLLSEVAFRGVLSDPELGKLLEESHALVLPSLYEGFGIAYLEAMGFGLPVIATKSGAAPEVITSGKQGFLIDPENAASLAGCLQIWIADREQLERMSLAALARFRSFPTWQETGEKITGFIHDFRGRQA